MKNTYIVTPLNDIKENMKNFDWAYDHLANLAFKVESNDGPKTIELKKYTPGETEDILKQIDADGFMPAPSPYVLGLGVQHPAVIKEYGYIVSLDEKNVLLDDFGDPCFLSLDWLDGRDLGLTRRAGVWYDDWWFAVVRKDTSKLNKDAHNSAPLVLKTSDTLSLEQMIGRIVMEGYTVSKNK